MGATLSALDYSLGDPGTDWRVRINGTDVSRLITGGSFEWSVVSLQPPAPIVQIGSLELAENSLAGVSFDLGSIAPGQAVTLHWRGVLIATARVAEAEPRDWDRFAVTPRAVSVALTDRLRQAAEGDALTAPVGVQSVTSWAAYAQRLLSAAGLSSNVSGLPTTIPGTGLTDGYSTAQTTADTNPVALASALAAVRGFALWIDQNEVVQFVSITDATVRRRLAVEQVRGLVADAAIAPPPRAVTVASTVTVVKRLNNDAQTIEQKTPGPLPNLTGQNGTVAISRRIIAAYDQLRRRQSETYRNFARRFTFVEGSTDSTLLLVEAGSKFEQFNSKGLLESVGGRKSVARALYNPNVADATLILIPPDTERWEYGSDDLPIRHIVERTSAAPAGDTIQGYVAERIVETWTPFRGQYRFRRQVFRPEDPDALEFTLLLVADETDDITQDQIISPPTAPVLRELEQQTVTARAEIEGGAGQEVAVSLLGASPSNAQRFCNVFALLAAKRAIPRRCERRLLASESLRPLTVEDVGRLRLRRDGIAVEFDGNQAVLSYSGIVEGIMSAPVPFPRRNIPTGALYVLPTPEEPTPPPPALRIVAIDPLTWTVGHDLPPVTITAVGGVPPYAFSADGLPAGLVLTGNVITGTPESAAVTAVTITVEDATEATASTTWTLTVAALPPVAVPTVTLRIAAFSAVGFAGRGAVIGQGPQLFSAVGFGSIGRVVEPVAAFSAVGFASIGVGPVLWTPAEISTSLWMDGADRGTTLTAGAPVAEGGAVAEWRDKSGDDRHFTAPTTAARPIVDDGALFFNGDKFMLGNAAAKDIARNVSALSIFHVISLSAGSITSTNMCRIADGDGAGRIRLNAGMESAFYRRLDSDPSTSVSYELSDPAGDGLTLTSHVMDYGDGEASVARNGVDFGVYHTFTNTGSTSDTASVEVGLAATLAGAIKTTGLFCEIIILQRIPTTLERQTIEGYLAHKWGFAAKLPAEHPFKTEPPFTS